MTMTELYTIILILSGGIFILAGMFLYKTSTAKDRVKFLIGTNENNWAAKIYFLMMLFFVLGYFSVSIREYFAIPLDDVLIGFIFLIAGIFVFLSNIFLDRLLYSIKVYIEEINIKNKELTAANKQIQKNLLNTVESLACAVAYKDSYTSGHCKKVSTIASGIAEKLNLDSVKVESIRLAGLLHDVGKIGIPAIILNKSEKLNKDEYDILKTHSQLGYNLLKDIKFASPIAQIVLQHHERLDGSGYPNGLKDDEILIEAKIVAIADIIEAMANDRPYRKALGLKKALDEIECFKGIRYDSKAVDACIELFNTDNFSYHK